jgi:CMP-N,N'-diacetyllegionaminic acid synthase
LVTKKANVVAIIPARGGSKGLPGKNIKPLAGKPLLGYAIESAKAASLVDRIVVTTDSEAIAKVAKDFGAEVPFLRPSDIADDMATTEATLQHAVRWLDEHGYEADIVVFLTCTAVFRDDAWIDEAVRRLLNDASLDSVFVAYKTHKNYWRKVGDEYVRLAPDIGYGSRQKREALYREDTPTTLAVRAKFIREGKRLGPKVDLIVTDDERITFDIHSEFDFWLAEKVIAEWPMSRSID